MAANTIEIIDKSGGSVTSVPVSGDVALSGPGVVKLPFGPEQLASTARVGDDLEVVLNNGERILLKDFFGPGADDRSELMLEDANGVVWLGQYDSSAADFAFAEVAEAAAAGGIPDWAWVVLGLLGAGAVAAIIDDNRSSSSKKTPIPDDDGDADADADADADEDEAEAVLALLRQAPSSNTLPWCS